MKATVLDARWIRPVVYRGRYYPNGGYAAHRMADRATVERPTRELP